MRTALQLAIEDPHRAVTFVGVSCAGAEVTDGLFLRYKGNEWVPNPPRYSQISAVAEAQCGSHKTDALDLPEAYHINGQIPELKGLVLRKCPLEEARKIDLVLFQTDGVIGRRFSIDLAPLRAQKKSVKLFDIDGIACDKIGSLLINDVMECKADGNAVDNCLQHLTTSTLTNVKLSK